MREWRYKKENGKEVWKELEKVIIYNSRDTIFEDWLDLILYSLLSLSKSGIDIFKKDRKNIDDYEKKYLEIVKKYGQGKERERGIDYLSKAFGLLIKETKEKQKDILGDIYMEMITFGEHGQFFTPEHITDVMAEINNIKDKDKIYDPCCGSGRFLISAGKLNPNVVLEATDLDERCVKMTAINMWIFGFNAKVSCGNSLLGEIKKTYNIFKNGLIYEN